MKQLLTIVFLLLFSMYIKAQEERAFLPVDWESIRKEVKENPDSIKELVKRLSAQETDTTMTYPEKVLAFYGQSFLINDSEDAFKNDMYKLANSGKLKECLAVAKIMLDINPINLIALTTANDVIRSMAINPIRWGNVSVLEAKIYYNRAMRIFDTIAMTGDGSEKHPFYVTKISDEYCFMRHYLHLWKYKGQEATLNCDIIKLGETSKYYNRPEIFFEVTRVYELERQRVMMGK